MLRRILLVLVPFAMLFGCQTAPVVLQQHCEIPASLDYVAQGAEKLPVEKTPVDKLLAADVKVRGHLALVVRDYNDLVGHIKRECQ